MEMGSVGAGDGAFVGEVEGLEGAFEGEAEGLLEGAVEGEAVPASRVGQGVSSCV